MNKIIKDKRNDLSDRLFDFSVKVIQLIRKLPKGKEYDVIRYQLIKAATSSGANYSPCQIESNYG